MSEVETFFRFCPSCGKRFHIKLIGKKLVDSKRETSDQKRDVMTGSASQMSYEAMSYRGGMPLMVEESIPVTVDVEDFQYSYKCKHCGHEWTENRVERQMVG